MTKLEVEHVIAATVADAEDELAGNAQDSDDDAPSTYSSIDALRRKQEALERALKPGLPSVTIMKPGEVPKQSAGPWSTGDHFGTEPLMGVSPDGYDPSGSKRFRGPG